MTQSKIRIEVIDDRQEFLDQCYSSIAKSSPGILDVQKRKVADIKALVRGLTTMHLQARKGKKPPTEPLELSRADIVFVDYDLLEFESDAGSGLTGEDVAYLLRCFSDCGLIVLMNSPDLGTNAFDLRLRRPMDSWEDLAIGSEQIRNSWLWTESHSGFSPWLWPNLIKAAARRRLQVKDLEKKLDLPVLDALQFPKEYPLSMDHVMASAISDQPGLQTRGCKVRELVLDNQVCGVPLKDTKILKQSKRIARIAAARISCWLERIVLPTQSMLLDAPHLALRLPALLTGDPSKIKAWQATASREGCESLKHSAIRKYRFSLDHWISRPVWFWQGIAGDSRYPEWGRVEQTPELAFTEDMSSFMKRSEVREFMADAPAQFALRYVSKSTGGGSPIYRPSARLR